MSIYGLILGICFVIGITFFQKNNLVIPKKLEIKFLFGLLISAIIGARIYSIINYWSYFSQNPLQILNFRGGGLGIFGGLVFGILFILVFSKIKNIPFLKITNTIVPIIPLCQSLGRFGNFFNHEIYGTNGQPVWLYESIFMFILFLIFKKVKTHQTAYYLLGYGIIRFILEFIRTDTIKIYFLSLGQVLSLLFILFSFIIIKYENSSNKSRFNHH